MNKTDIADAIDAYTVLGGNRAASHRYAFAPIVALSVAFVARGRARYRIATLADGARALAEGFRGRGYEAVRDMASVERLLAEWSAGAMKAA